MRKDQALLLATVVALILSCHVANGQKFAQTCSDPVFPSAATDIDSACGVTGAGGKEATQNSAKNSFCAQGDPQAITFDKLKQLQVQVDNDRSIPFGRKGSATRHAGPAIHRGPLQNLGEGSSVTLTAFVFKARQEGAESVNCGKPPGVPDEPAYHDIHIALVSSATEKDECKGIVAEMSPHHRPADWTADNVNKLVRAQLPIRVSGQLFFDSSHSPCQGGEPSSGDPKRFSLWEIHPIYKFEVCTGDCNGTGRWQSFSDWLKNH